MSAPLDTLEHVAKLLPEDRRERFYALIARLQNVPEDDEYLLILEAIGFMTLLWREVPEQVREIVGSVASPGGHPDSNGYLAAELRKAVTESLDVPTYADMRRLAAQWDEQQSMFKAAAHRLTGQLAQTPPSSSSGNVWPIVGAFLLGVIATYLSDRWLADAVFPLRHFLEHLKNHSLDFTSCISCV